MAYGTPRLHWDRRTAARATAGRTAVAVPAELTTLDARARALLKVRLARRCRIAEADLRADGETAVLLVGVAPEDVDDRFRAVADAVLASIAHDAAAGWTAEDEAALPEPLTREVEGWLP